MKYFDLKVYGHFINSIRAETRLRPALALAELIDNALDAEATHIQITFDSEADLTRIVDNGRGSDSLEPFFHLGYSKESQGAARIGRYGVGGKKAAALVCNTEVVRTHHRGVTHEGRIEWTKIAEEGAPFQVAAEEPVPTSLAGTEIVLHGDRCDTHSSKRAQACRAYWSKVFMPALRDGKQITFNGLALEPKPFPALRAGVEVVGTLSGRSYHAIAGILQSEKEAGRIGWDPGFYVACMGRLLFEEAWDNATDYIGVPVWAYITLLEDESNKWDLDTHKVDLSETERDELFADFVPKITLLLEAARDEHRNVEFTVISEEMSAVLASALGGKAAFLKIKEKRASPANKTGSVEPKDTGQMRTKAEKADPTKSGSVIDFPKISRSQQIWDVQFAEMMPDTTVGKAVVMPSKAVMKFNLSNDWVSANRRNLDALLPAALACIWAEADSRTQDRLWAAIGLKEFPMEYTVTQQMCLWYGAALKQIEANKEQSRKAVREVRKQRREEQA